MTPDRSTDLATQKINTNNVGKKRMQDTEIAMLLHIEIYGSNPLFPLTSKSVVSSRVRSCVAQFSSKVRWALLLTWMKKMCMLVNANLKHGCIRKSFKCKTCNAKTMTKKTTFYTRCCNNLAEKLLKQAFHPMECSKDKARTTAMPTCMSICCVNSAVS